jgi:hypothetical protein
MMFELLLLLLFRFLLEQATALAGPWVHQQEQVGTVTKNSIVISIVIHHC